VVAAERSQRSVVTVVALTSTTTRVFPFQVLVPAGQAGLRVDSKAQAEQVRSVAVERLGPALGRLPAPVMAEFDEALKLHLDLWLAYWGSACAADADRPRLQPQAPVHLIPKPSRIGG
jgi:mRNA-degrading endonuclease toxin of MazEF toxin-antitoxin module